MKQTWRWFGPHDAVSLSDVRQAGATGIVTALHHVPAGEVWLAEEIAARHAAVEMLPDGAASGLRWEVVESVPVSEDIKRQTGAWKAHIEAYKQSLANLAESGIAVVCYNFMPVLDWTRTDLRFATQTGAVCMLFDAARFAAFDLFILKRPGAGADHSPEMRAAAEACFAGMSEAQRATLLHNVTCGLPGAAEGYSLEDLAEHLALYDGIGAARLRQHQIDFLSEVVPTAERVGVRLCCHSDDPPYPLLGLPRIMSTEEDYRTLVEAIPSPANGITFCTGSLGVRPEADLPGMVARLGPHIHFVHLRNVSRLSSGSPPSFYEAQHLEGETDMVAVIRALLAEEAARVAAGRRDSQIPFRPDHGQEILSDIGVEAQPGYPAVGRLKGLAELRGIIHGLGARPS